VNSSLSVDVNNAVDGSAVSILILLVGQNTECDVSAAAVSYGFCWTH